MRIFFSTTVIIISLLLLSLAAPRFIAAVGNLIGNEAVTLAVDGHSLNEHSYQRAVRSREHSLNLYTDRATYTQLGLLHYNQFILAARGAIDQFSKKESYRHAATAAFLQSLAITPVQPTLWLILAEFALRDEKRAEASAALDWSFRTGYYHRPIAERRVEMAFVLWNDLQPLTRERILTTLVALAGQQPDVLARVAINAGMAEDVMDFLERRKPDGALLAARFFRAVGDYSGFVSPLVSQVGNKASIERLLASATLMITFALPAPGFAMTIEEYQAIRSGENTAWSESDVMHYLVGVLDATIMTGEMARMQGNAVLCMTEDEITALDPNELKVTLDLMLDQFEQEMPNFRELAQTRTIGIATLQLLTYLYPCEDTSLAN